MNLHDLCRALSYGEFSNLSLGMDGQGSIRESDIPRIVQHANEGLLRLYSQFILKEQDVLVEMVEGVTYYHLDKRFAESYWSPEETLYPYIKDLGREPFQEDVIKILSVHDSYGRQLPLNDNECPASLFTPQAKLLQVPHVIPGECLAVLYQAKHPTLSHERLEDVLLLPDVLVGALTAFIAWKVYSFMNTAESTNKAREHKTRYDEICLGVSANDLVQTSISTTNVRFAKRGWI